jgi:hypothetical protein
MKKFRIPILVLLVFINSCSKEDEVNSLNELVDTLGNKIAQLNSLRGLTSSSLEHEFINTNRTKIGILNFFILNN